MPLIAPATPPACPPAALSIRTGGDQGDFNGMSHSGTYLIVTNRSRRACSVPGLPTITLRDARGRSLPIVRRAPAGMHPGPAVVAVRLAPRASAQTGLRWVSGPVYDNSHCYDVASITLLIDRRALRTPLAAHLCTEAGKQAAFEQPLLAPAPR